MPLFSVIYFTGTAPSNSATFDLEYILQNPQGTVSQLVGARAPNQSFWGLAFDFGQYFASPATAEIFQPNSPTALANTRVKVNYIPIFIIGSGITILIIWKVVKLRRNKPVKSNTKEPEFHTHAEIKNNKK